MGYGVKIIFSGLAVAQLLSLLHVRLSNIRYYEKLMAIRDAGYLAIPASGAMERLSAFGSAFWGGLFFTLSVGLCLTFIGMGAAWIWDRILKRDRRFIVSALVFWLGLVLLLNSGGFSILATSYVLVIPPLVFGLSARRMPQSQDRNAAKKGLAHIVCFILLAGLGSGHLTASGFSLIRDHLLLTHPVGIHLNNLYYTHTLYAAQVFKSPAQDPMRTCRISVSDADLSGRLRRVMLSCRYLVTDRSDVADLEIAGDRQALVFKSHGREILTVSHTELMRKPGKTLKAFSQQCDRYGGFRQFTFLSLLLVSGLCIYLILWLPFRLIFSMMPNRTAASFFPIAACLIAGSVGIFVLQARKPPVFSPAALKAALSSGAADQRVEALKYAVRNREDIGRFGVQDRMAHSPHMPERYWLVRALAFSHAPSTYETVLTLLDDPQINVAYTAFDVLARRGERQAVGEILKRIERSEHWYVQLYACSALRRLGWKQSASR
ncbi:hypothetical protein DENIS_2626 [Desulfonema ishimotonii]|uniref:HEAT repeat domain-containing protein n=1 Tax=Desulfonema ishimotonii TaxID=45657 RepID=A0A401FXJ8_9BACT|nr:HEAT repeat domain-containing protein [Desulfonema ishimotonii]GBC61664.1 hypothetical protein DENIS_2626 [Desulfonema ishimotonii]